MSPTKLRRFLIIPLSIIATIALAYIFGVEAGNLINSRNQKRYVHLRELTTKQILEKMENLNTGDTIPDYAFHDLDLNLHLLSELVHRRTVLSFVDPGCGACLSQIEAVQRAVEDTGDFKYFLLISSTNPLLLKEYRDKFNIRCRILYDEDKMLKDRLGVSIAPFNLIINPSLEVERVIAGDMAGGDFREIIELNKDLQ